jgi:hypothetical protein
MGEEKLLGKVSMRGVRLAKRKLAPEQKSLPLLRRKRCEYIGKVLVVGSNSKFGLASIGRLNLELFNHKGHQMGPTLKEEILGQGGEVMKEGFSG